MFYAAQLERLSFLPHGNATEMVSIYAAIGTEAAIPLLLAFRRTRVAGILVGSIFHVFLAINPLDRFYNFSSILLAVFSLFAPASVIDSAPRGPALQVVYAHDPGGNPCGFVLQRWLPSSPSAASIRSSSSGMSTRHRHRLLRGSPAARAAPPLGIPILRDPRTAPARPSIVVFLNGLTPYVGLKTEIAWAMFSNLRTEGDRTNHFLVPARLQAFDLSARSRAVTSSSDRILDLIARKGQLVPYFEVRRRPSASVSYVRNGVEYRFARVSDDPAFTGTDPDCACGGSCCSAASTREVSSPACTDPALSLRASPALEWPECDFPAAVSCSRRSLAPSAASAATYHWRRLRRPNAGDIVALLEQIDSPTSISTRPACGDLPQEYDRRFGVFSMSVHHRDTLGGFLRLDPIRSAPSGSAASRRCSSSSAGWSATTCGPPTTSRPVDKGRFGSWPSPIPMPERARTRSRS